jgi:tetratricopeptide (TPR) repeat protein
MKRLVTCGLALTLALPCMGQNIVLKNGNVIATKGVRRAAGDTIMATIELPSPDPAKPPQLGEFGYPIAQIAKLEFPDPGLKNAAALINAGNPDEAVKDLDAVLTYYNGIGDAPGSWWADLTLLKIRALIALGREGDAQALAGQMAGQATDPDHVRAANIYALRGGDPARAMAAYDETLAGAAWPEALAAAAVGKGQAHVARKEWAQALLALLQVPVFYPDQEVLMPDVLLGSARAYIGLHDFPRAKAALADLGARFGETPDAAEAPAELARIAKLEKALSPEQ